MYVRAAAGEKAGGSLGNSAITRRRQRKLERSIEWKCERRCGEFKQNKLKSDTADKDKQCVPLISRQN